MRVWGVDAEVVDDDVEERREHVRAEEGEQPDGIAEGTCDGAWDEREHYDNNVNQDSGDRKAGSAADERRQGKRGCRDENVWYRERERGCFEQSSCDQGVFGSRWQIWRLDWSLL